VGVDQVRGQGRILLMDDDATIRTVTGRMLRAMGYEVTLCADGEGALEAFRAAAGTPDAFAAVILDLTVPGKMGGIDTAKAMLEIVPDVKAIVSSGYSDGRLLGRHGDAGFRAVLPKPFTMEELGEIVRSVLAEE